MKNVINHGDLDAIKAVHRKNGLVLHTASGLSGRILDGNGSGTAVIDAMLNSIDASLAKDQHIAALERCLASRPTEATHNSICREMRHWQREAVRLAKIAGKTPRAFKDR